MNDMSTSGFDRTDPAPAHDVPPELRPAGLVDNTADPIGVILDIAGSSSMIALDPQRLQE